MKKLYWLIGMILCAVAAYYSGHQVDELDAIITGPGKQLTTRGVFFILAVVFLAGVIICFFGGMLAVRSSDVNKTRFKGRRYSS